MQDKGLYDSFAAKIASVNGECYRAADRKELLTLITEALQKRKAAKVALFPSPLLTEAGVPAALTEGGYEVIIDDLRRRIPQAAVGITEAQWGIAELGTLVQYAPEVDNRLCSTLVDTHIALLKSSAILPELDDALAAIASTGALPNYVGFITGPSRSSDIERVLTVGVHGPIELVVIVVDEGGR
ncbi:MAG: lactate utilization protein C [Gracilibacteraceae bacterium]|jgi:L-lactate dehydrogenase complex protein LldG|nr:lactate utilization protein C [Gracilibacteraceae bacterium]